MSRRVSFAALLVAAVFAIGACDAAGPTAEPAASAGGSISVTPTLLPEAAVAATIGPDGGVIEAADAARGLSYRLEVPAGAFFEDTEVSVTPIAELGGFPFDGGLLGGVQLTPEGQQFLVPVILEIGLDANRRSALQALIDDGMFVVGFAYEGAGENLAVDLVEVADDLSTVRLTLFHFSGRGGGTGRPGNLANLPCPPDPANNAKCQISKILHPTGRPLDWNDPAVVAQVRAQIVQVFRDWLDVLVVLIDVSTDDPAEFAAAFQEARVWWATALVYSVEPGDALMVEGQRLDDAVRDGWLKAFDRANEHCKTTVRSGPLGGQDLDNILALLDLHAKATTDGLGPPQLGLIPALGPGTFCVRFTITPQTPLPKQLREGHMDAFRFNLHDSSGGVWRDSQLDTLQAAMTLTVADPSLLTASLNNWAGFYLWTDVTAVRAIPGNSAEGRFDIGVSLFGMTTSRYGSESFTFDITSLAPTPPPPITCSGDPTTIRSINEEAFIGIRFDGASTCAVVPNLTDDDDQNAMLALDVDPGESGWDAHDGGNWSRESLGSNQAPGTYSVRVRHDPSGRLFTLTFTVDVALVSGGPAVSMTVREVTITPLGT